MNKIVKVEGINSPKSYTLTRVADNGVYYAGNMETNKYGIVLKKLDFDSTVGELQTKIKIPVLVGEMLINE